MQYSGGTNPGQLFTGSNKSINVPQRLVPSIQHVNISSGSGYKTNGFLNSENTQSRLGSDIQKIHPDLSKEVIDSIASIGVQSFSGLIEENTKNQNGFAYFAKGLPENTTWNDLEIKITGYNEYKPQETRADIYLFGKCIKTTNFHEMELEDTVKRRISLSGNLLFLIGIGKKFSWEDEKIPENYRKAKERLADSLKKFFGIGGEPMMLGTKEYISKIRITANLPLTEEYSHLDITNYFKAY